MKKPEYLIVSDKRETLTSGRVVEKGIFLAERQATGAYLNQSAGLNILPIGKTAFNPPPIAPGDTVLIVRPGGFGDLLFLTPVIRRLNEMGCRVEVASFPEYAVVLEANTDIYGLVPYPVPLDIWHGARVHVWLERILEDGVDSQVETLTANAVDLIAKACGIEITDKSMRYDVTPGEAKWVRKAYPPKGNPRVGIQLHASATNRSYPWRHLQILAALLADEGKEVMLFGSPGSLPECEGPFVNLTADGLTFRQSCAVLSTCDAVVAPDSSLCHVAGALGIPTVALYGPFLSQTRTKYAASVHAVNGKAPCAPCNFHDNIGKAWPAGCPGWKTGCCAALENIPPGMVAAQVSYMIAAAENMKPEIGNRKDS